MQAATKVALAIAFALVSSPGMAQTPVNLEALKGLAPVATMTKTHAGHAALSSNLAMTGAIQTGSLPQTTQLPFHSQQQQALRDQAADQLRRSEFRAPIAGRIISVDIKPGETVIAGTTNIIGSDLMTLADTSALLAELRVDEADIARIRLDQAVDVFAAARPDAAIPGRVVHIGSSARKIGTTEGLAFRVRVLLDGAGTDLSPGMSCRAEIVTAQGADTLKMPVAALRRDAGGAFVWRLTDDGTVRRTPVTPGLSNDIEQAVESGLDAGQRVVTGPGRLLAQLAEGQRVSVTDDAADTPDDATPPEPAR